MFSFNEYLVFFACYVIGSIPFGILVARFYGVKNITEQGSKNSGATNVTRVAGKKAGVITLLLDFLKAYIPLYFIAQQNYNIFYIAAGLFVIGHCFSIFRRFTGGKGVATGLGTVFAINPIIGLYLLIVWVLIFLLTKISSASALAAFGLLPIIAFFMNPEAESSNYMIYVIALSLLIYVKHWRNIVRLLNGEEKSFKKKS